jgi:hypothetical protein
MIKLFTPNDEDRIDEEDEFDKMNVSQLSIRMKKRQ